MTNDEMFQTVFKSDQVRGQLAGCSEEIIQKELKGRERELCVLSWKPVIKVMQ